MQSRIGSQLGKYTIVEDLTVSGNAAVFRAIKGNNTFVLKEVRDLGSIGQRELRMHQQVEACNPQNVIRLAEEGSFSGKYFLVLVQENFAHDLRDVRPDICATVLLNCALHTLRGMEELRSVGLIHDDIKELRINNVFN